MNKIEQARAILESSREATEETIETIGSRFGGAAAAMTTLIADYNRCITVLIGATAACDQLIAETAGDNPMAAQLKNMNKRVLTAVAGDVDTNAQMAAAIILSEILDLDHTVEADKARGIEFIRLFRQAVSRTAQDAGRALSV